eukprot:9506-Hanusia_phi.AAC.1
MKDGEDKKYKQRPGGRRTEGQRKRWDKEQEQWHQLLDHWELVVCRFDLIFQLLQRDLAPPVTPFLLFPSPNLLFCFSDVLLPLFADLVQDACRHLNQPII